MMKRLVTALLILAPLAVLATAPAPTSSLSLQVKEQPLVQVLEQLRQRSGIDVKLPTELQRDPVTFSVSAKDLRQLIDAVLAGYNHVNIINGSGRLKRVIVTGRAGDGKPVAQQSTPAATTTLLEPIEFRAAVSGQLPGVYKAMKPGSVYALNLDAEVLKAMQTGESINLPLPDGDHQVVQDNRVTHKNGDVSWVGYLKGQGNDYRFIATLGKNGVDGQVQTPAGLYYLRSANGGNWLIDVNASGLQNPTRHESWQIPGQASDTNQIINALASTVNPGTISPAASDGPATNVVTLLVLTAPSFAGDTRLNQLLTIANQAYIDSGVNIHLQLLKAEPVNYGNASPNNNALTELTGSGHGQPVGGLPDVRALRDGDQADIVMLIRPFQYPDHQSCGVSWVNGVDASYGYSVVSDGSSPSGYYCSDYTFVHELGHALGASHDREHSGVPGLFAYCYGYGVPGVFGTIMSYVRPRIGKFSNPNINCSASSPYACGTATEDNARCLNETAPMVAAFR